MYSIRLVRCWITLDLLCGALNNTEIARATHRRRVCFPVEEGAQGGDIIPCHPQPDPYCLGYKADQRSTRRGGGYLQVSCRQVSRPGLRHSNHSSIRLFETQLIWDLEAGKFVSHRLGGNSCKPTTEITVI